MRSAPQPSRLTAPRGYAFDAISLSFVAGKPPLRLYERFGFKAVEAKPDASEASLRFLAAITIIVLASATMAQASPAPRAAVDPTDPVVAR